jgi:hypothetical protein
LIGNRDPNDCSQCRGHTARRVTTAANGQMVIDGVPADRKFFVVAPVPRNAMKARARRARRAQSDALDQDDDID